MQENLVLCQGEKHNISLACHVIGCGSITLGTIIAPPLYQISGWKQAQRNIYLNHNWVTNKDWKKITVKLIILRFFWSVCISPSLPHPHLTSWSKDPIIGSMVRSTDPRSQLPSRRDFTVALFLPPNSIKLKHGSLFFPKIHELLAVNLFFEGSLPSNF